MDIIFATSRKKDGSMGLARDLNTRAAAANRARFLRKFGIPPSRAVRAELVHGAKVTAVTIIPRLGFVPRTDALVTNRKNTFLFILSADCFPIFFYHTVSGAVGIAHAGWRSISKGVVPYTIHALKKFPGVKSKDLRAVIGPGIRKCHFEVKKDILPKFKKYAPFILRKSGKLFIDLAGIIKNQMSKNGIPSQNIFDTGKCTYHETKRYFSYRRDRSPGRPRGLGNMLSVIGFGRP